MVNSDTFAGLSLNLAKFIIHKFCVSIVCKPTLEYLQAKYLEDKVSTIFYLLLYFVTRLLVMWNIARFDLNIVISNHIRKKLQKYSKNEIKLIPLYGIDKIFSPPKNKTKREIKEKLSLPKDKYIIFVSSRISPEKDFKTLFKAVKSLIHKGVRDIILLNLSGQYKDFMDMAKAFDLENFVIGKPAINPYKLTPYYQAADLCIQPSLFEGLGFSPLESLSCGTPVIVAHTGGMKESTIPGIHSLHYKANSPQDLEKKIIFTYKHRKEMKKMAMEGSQWVLKKYNSQEVFKKFKLAVEELTAL